MNIVARWHGIKDRLGIETHRILGRSGLVAEAQDAIKAECGQSVERTAITTALGLSDGYCRSAVCRWLADVVISSNVDATRANAVSTNFPAALTVADEWLAKMASWSPEHIRHVAEGVLLGAS